MTSSDITNLKIARNNKMFISVMGLLTILKFNNLKIWFKFMFLSAYHSNRYLCSQLNKNIVTKNI